MSSNRIDRRSFLALLTAVTSFGSAARIFEAQAKQISPEERSYDPSKVPLVYAPDYNISAFGLEALHPFDGNKFGKIQKSIVSSGRRTKKEFLAPKQLSNKQLSVVHTERYLDSLKHSDVLARIFEVWPAALIPGWLLDWRILYPMRLASGGTLMTCRLALESGLAINLGGGYHHADRAHGGGFCVYSDVPIALEILRSLGCIERALVIDTDAHQGNGFANVLHGSGWAFILDFFDESIYPFPKAKEDVSIALPIHTKGDYYLDSLFEHVPEAIDKFKPDLIVYNAGSDVLDSDPLSTLRLAEKDLAVRDSFVVETARSKNIPLAMVLAGGYSKESASAHSQSILRLLKTYDK